MITRQDIRKAEGRVEEAKQRLAEYVASGMHNEIHNGVHVSSISIWIAKHRELTNAKEHLSNLKKACIKRTPVYGKLGCGIGVMTVCSYYFDADDFDIWIEHNNKERSL